MNSHDGKTKGAAPCQPHPLASQPGAVLPCSPGSAIG